MTKKLISLICILTIFLVGCGKLENQDIEDYAATFCQTTSHSIWEDNKTFLLSRADESLHDKLIQWFKYSNYSDKMQVNVKSHISDIKDGTGFSMLLLECSNNDLNYWVSLELIYYNNKVIDFNYKSIDEMRNGLN